MQRTQLPEYIQTVVIGAGQSGLSVGYHLAQRGLPFVILDANERVGDAWRNRWDSLRLFTSSSFNGLAGMPFPAPGHTFPTKDEMADFLEGYARHFRLPVRMGVKVNRLSRAGGRYVVETDDGVIDAENVVVAMSNFQRPRRPAFADELAPGIKQLHSIDYRGPSQLQKGDVLIVGAGNSGADLAMELSNRHRVWMSGRDTGHIPFFRIDGRAARFALNRLVLRFLFHRVLTVDTPMGRKARPRILSTGGPLVRVKPSDLERAGVERVPRTVGVSNGLPLLEDGRVLDVGNVIWCTGYHTGFTWIDLPVHGELSPTHERGIVADQPGLYFVGLHFLYSLSSTMIHGVARDAERVVTHLAERTYAPRLEPVPRPLAAAS